MTKVRVKKKTAPKKKPPRISTDPEAVFDIGNLKQQRIDPIPMLKKPKYQCIPPIRTLPIEIAMDLAHDMPESIIEQLKPFKPSNKLREHGVPTKIMLSQQKIQDMSLISTYMISEELRKHYLELYVENQRQYFWLMAMTFKPNHPYFAIITSEENSNAGNVLAAYFANYYLSLTREGDDSLVQWYRSLEFVPYKKPKNVSGVVIIQCRWPSWVDNHQKLLRTLMNVRAAFENATLILLIAEEDLCIAPMLLTEEPFGVFVKVAMKDAILPDEDDLTTQRPKTPISKVMRSIRRLQKKK